MAAFMKLGDIKGEATDDGHKDWIIIESLSSAVYRSVPEGAKDQQRTKGETTLGDCVLVRQLDCSTVDLMKNSANGTFFKKVEIHFCTTVKNKQEPYMKYELSDVIISSHSFHGNSSGSPLPSEEVTLGYSAIKWTYVTVDPKTGDTKGNVVGEYNPGEGKGS